MISIFLTFLYTHLFDGKEKNNYRMCESHFPEVSAGVELTEAEGGRVAEGLEEPDGGAAVRWVWKVSQSARQRSCEVVLNSVVHIGDNTQYELINSLRD